MARKKKMMNIENEEWDIFENCEECPEMGEEYKIQVQETAKKQISTMLKMSPDLEWMAGLKGKIKDNKYYIEELVVFEQEVSGVSVELTDKGNLDFANTKDLIGWIHSHNIMTAFFSETDKKNALQHKVSLVVNNNLEIKGLIAKQLTCNRKTLINTDVAWELEMNKSFWKKAKEMIKENTLNYNEYDEQYCMVCTEKLEGRVSILEGGMEAHYECAKREPSDLERDQHLQYLIDSYN